MIWRVEERDMIWRVEERDMIWRVEGRKISDKELKIEKMLAITPFICNFAAQNVITNKIIDNNK